MSTARPETFNDEKLAEEQEFLLRSLDDLEDEHSNGDLSDSEYETLRNDYMRRLAAVARARKGETSSTFDHRPSKPLLVAASYRCDRSHCWNSCSSVLRLKSARGSDLG